MPGRFSRNNVGVFGYRTWIALFVFLATANIVPHPASAEAAPREPRAFIQDLGNRAINLLSNKTASVKEQRTGFRALLREGFATRAIGYFVIGKYRRGAARKTVNEFINTFENYVVELYSSQFKNYTGETFKVLKVIKTNRPSDSIVVTNILRPTGEKIFKIAFQVRQRPKKPTKILDVKIQGVSMILAQRDEFTGYISQNDGKLQALVDVLKLRIEKLRNKDANKPNGDTGPGIPGIDASPQPTEKPVKEKDDSEEEQDQG